MFKLFAKVLIALCVFGGVAYAAQKVIFFTGGDVATSNEKAAITSLAGQAAKPYTVVVRSGPRARLRATPESADFYAGAIPPNYRDGGIDSGTAFKTVYSVTDPPDPASLVTTQAILRHGDHVHLAGGGTVTFSVSSNTITVSAYTAPDGGT